MTKPNTSLKISLPVNEKTGIVKLLSILIESLIAMMFLLGLGGSLQVAFLPEFMMVELLFVGVLGCLIFTVLLGNRRLGIIGLIIIVVWLIIFCVALQADMLDGLRLITNHINELVGRRFATIVPIYDIGVAIGEYSVTTTLFLVPICLLLSLLCSWLVRARDVIVSLAIMSGLIFAIVFLRTDFPIIWLLVLALAEVFLLTKAHESKNNFVKYLSPGSIIIPAMAAMILVLSAGLILANMPLYTNPLAETRSDLVRKSNRVRYGIDTTRGMTDGDFKNLEPFRPSHETALEVTMSRPESLWLRGFVGSKYEGWGWQKDNPAELFANANLFYWLHEGNFYGQKQIADAAITTGLDSAEQAFGIHINNIGASSQNIYAPYEVYLASVEQMPANSIGDITLVNQGLRGMRAYQYFSMPNQVKHYPDIMQRLFGDDRNDNGMIEAYLLVESNYAQYVHEQYTQLPTAVKNWVEEYLEDIIPHNNEANYNDVRQAIIKYFTNETEYSTAPNSSNSGDLAYDFLLLDKSGYSVHYATAATLLFRACGIPARYVEGYLITPKDVEGVAFDTVFQIDGTHAHAWVEVYQNGVGWVPVEMTPPYFGLMEEADVLQGIPGIEQTNDIPPIENDIIEEQIEDPEAIENEETAQSHRQLMVIILIIIAIILIAILLAGYLLRRQYFIKSRLVLCLNDSNSIAVMGMFAYGIEVLEYLGFKADGIWLASHLALATPTITGISPTQFQKVFSIYEEAGYSKHEISNEKRKEVKAFLSSLNILLQSQYSGLRRVKVSKVLKVLTIINDTEQG